MAYKEFILTNETENHTTTYSVIGFNMNQEKLQFTIEILNNIKGRPEEKIVTNYNITHNPTIKKMIPNPSLDKPEGFDINNPDTWGDISVNDIPMIPMVVTDSKFMQFLEQESGCLTIREVLTRRILEFLQAEAYLPATKEFILKKRDVL